MGCKAKFIVNLAFFSLLDTHHRRALVLNLSTTSWEKPVQAAFAKNSLTRKASSARAKKFSPQLSKAILTHADAALCAGVAGKQLVRFLAVTPQSCVMRTQASMSGEVNSTRSSFRHG